VYRMYPWDDKGASEADAPVRSGAKELTAALQLALDRRDNNSEDVVEPLLPSKVASCHR
jgi:hypothetical protein